jgi:hypothetical protein
VRRFTLAEDKDGRVRESRCYSATIMMTQEDIKPYYLTQHGNGRE